MMMIALVAETSRIAVTEAQVDAQIFDQRYSTFCIIDPTIIMQCKRLFVNGWEFKTPTSDVTDSEIHAKVGQMHQTIQKLCLNL